MVDIKTEWNEQNVKEYIRYMMFLRNKISKLVMIFLTVCCTFTLVFCLISFFAFGYDFTIIFALAIVLIAVAYFVFFALIIKGAAKNILKVNAGSELNRVMISEDDILGFNGDDPVGVINWNKMDDIYFNEKTQTVYLTTKKNAVLILECKNILSGTSDELKEIVGAKRDELSKEA